MTIPLTIFCGVFGTILCTGYFILAVSDRYGAALELRVRELRGTTRRATKKPREDAAWKEAPPAKGLKWAYMQVLTSDKADRQYNQSRLIKAGIYYPSAIVAYYATRLICMVVPPVVGALLVWTGHTRPSLGLIIGSMLGFAGIIIPSFWLDRRITRRHSALRRSMSDFLDLMVVCLEGGLGLQGAMLRVTDELRAAHPDLAGELSIVERDVELGATVDAALRRFADRSGFEGPRSLSTLVRESQRFGTQLVSAMRANADMLRSQRESTAEENAQKASVKILIPMLLLILPAIFVVLAGPAAIKIQESFSRQEMK